MNKQISILTLNICGVNILTKYFFEKNQKITDIINEEDIDIINFQEVVFYSHLRHLEKSLRKYPYIIYKKSLLGPKAGLVTFSRLPLKIVKFQKFKKNGNLHNLSIIHKLAQRGMLVSNLLGTSTNIVNTHFSANISKQWKKENHYIKVLKSQIKELKQLIQLNKEKFFLISGDFNIPKTSYLYQDLTCGNLVDIFKDIDKPTHLGDLFFTKTDNLQIDYIFISKKDNIQTTVISKKFLFDKKEFLGSQRKYLSDHIGLKACIQIRSPNTCSPICGQTLAEIYKGKWVDILLRPHFLT